ncbi:polysialyltransferase family glycosyltransferase [Acrocarpospora catenulata]|uniref:polysialyltransferase family glycosyltransferase n=1 Tax=Acrocarpospora catenulata TaxID=2836182 RepID=UPI001BDA797D|nr:polysialyltransferase family glycosyltransferase [Acrocarpospora catenulata]
MTTQLFSASTLFGAMTLAAAIDAGQFGDADRRVLLVSSNALIPELVRSPHQAPGFAGIADRFDRVWWWNELIAPYHPERVRVAPEQGPLLARLLGEKLELPGGVDELVVEPVGWTPARALTTIFPDCPVTVYAEGLGGYGPARSPVPARLAARITRLLHLDLVPGLRPLLLAERRIPAVPVPDAEFEKVVAEVAEVVPRVPEADAIILGQCLADTHVLDWQEEDRLHATMLRGLAARGYGHVLFKPHPVSGRRQAAGLRRLAGELGIRLSVAPETVPAEVCVAAHRPELVVGAFSTGLMTVRHFFGVPVATVGCPLVLRRLRPYRNVNRVPATIVDATVPRLTAAGGLLPPPVRVGEVGALVEAVAYCLQPNRFPQLRPVAESCVRELPKVRRYLRSQRLAEVGLVTVSPGRKLLGRIARAGRKLAKVGR